MKKILDDQQDMNKKTDEKKEDYNVKEPYK